MTDQPKFSPHPLAANFDALTIDNWRGLAEAALKGADFDKTLTSKTYDGISINPVYPRAENAANIAPPVDGQWQVVQRMDQGDITAANRQALVDLENGASGLALVFCGAPTAYGYGVSVNTLEDLDQALKGVILDIVHLRLEAGVCDTAAAALLVALCEKRGIDLGKLEVSLGCDPFGAAIVSGKHPSRDEKIPQFIDMALALDKRGFTGRIALADGRVWHGCGASEAQELAGILAAAVAYLRAFEKAGIPLEKAVERIEFALAADADQFLTIAKVRALQVLWRRICENCGVADAPVHIHCETAWRMMTRRDVYVNMLRATIATFAAGISGAKSITVLPFTAALGLPDEFARRIARNTQLVLLEESNLAKVGDPVTGSGFTETMTHELTAKAWQIFQRTEKHGGLAPALKDGWMQNEVRKTRAERINNIAKRKDPLTGVSEFPNLGEPDVVTLGDDPPWPLKNADPLDFPAPGKGEWFEALVAAAVKGASLAQLSEPTLPGFEIAPLSLSRLGESFERLRDAADDYAKKNGNKPIVFLANLGTTSTYAARASWVTNAFASGGIEALSGDGFADATAAAGAFKKSGANLACICSDDATYSTQGAQAAEALKGAGASHVFLAGRAGKSGNVLAEAGVGTFVYAGCDIVEVLKTALSALGADVKGEEK